MRSVWEEARRAFRLTFVDGMKAARLGVRSHAGWWADPHLRRGYLVAFPIFVVGALLTFAGFLRDHTYTAFFVAMLPAAFLCNLVWFAVAARSRARSGE